MASFITRLAALYLRLSRRPHFLSAQALEAAILAVRRHQDHRPPPKTVGGLRVTRRQQGAMPVYELAMPSATGTPLLYLHGGAFCFEITPFHWALIAQLAVATGRPVVVPIYPLAPEHGAEEVLDGLMALWREMTGEGACPAVVGDSAGGTLALSLSLMAQHAALPQPSALGLLSPCLDLTLSHPEIPAYAARDPWLAVEGAGHAARLYARDLALEDWRISPGRADPSSLPPSLLFMGDRELLYPDARDFAADRETITLVEGKGLFHVWPLLPIPEARRARAQLIAFLKQHAAP